MRRWFWLRLARILRFQTFVQAIIGLVTIAAVMTVLMLFGDYIRWPMLPLFVAFYSMVGIGIDLQKVTLGKAFVAGGLACTAIALLMIIAMNGIFRFQGLSEQRFPLMEGLEIYVPLFFLMALSIRWCLSSEARKAIARGTARFNKADVEKRKEEIEEFKRKRQV